MSICIVVPMKSPHRAKQRLSHDLSPVQRQALAMQLFRHTLSFLRSYFSDLDTLVVSDSEEVLATAREYNCLTLQQDEPSGLNPAVQDAAHWVSQRDYSGMLVLPGDLALLNEADITQLLNEASAHDAVLAIADDGGTNALLVQPADSLCFSYGHNSALKHQQECVRRGLSFKALNLPRLALDIDQLKDLQQAEEASSEALQGWNYA